jgi:hypothetical protein
MLPVRHFHVVFTLPSELRPFAGFNPEVVYDRMLKAAAQTICELCEDHHGLLPGVTVVLHTWTREMTRHIHVHCLVSAGGEDVQTGGWKPIDHAYLLDTQLMGALFRGKLLAMLKATHGRTPLHLPDALPLKDLLRPLYAKRWVVYAKAPLDGPHHLVRYLGAYTHRVAISDSRIVRLGDHDVTFRVRGRRTATLTDAQFLDRFRLHILPKGFRKVRHFGLYAPGRTARLEHVGNDYVEQFDDLPPDADVRTTDNKGLLCPACQQGFLRFDGLLPTPPAPHDTS